MAVTRAAVTAWKKLADEATPGPWRQTPGTLLVSGVRNSQRDWSFIAAARTAVPALCNAYEQRETLLCDALTALRERHTDIRHAACDSCRLITRIEQELA